MASKKHARSESSEHIDGLKHPSTKVAKKVDAHPPFERLVSLLESSSSDSKPRNVLHWFRSKDLRMQDNKALYAASQKAKEGDSLITAYLHSPSDLEWHGTSPARTDFILETLSILQKDLSGKNVPLAILTADERGQKTSKVLDFVEEHDISHIYANFEYEVDELRRDIDLAEKLKERSVGFELYHDQTVVVPGELKTGAGGPMKVFTPYHKAWLSETKSDPSLLDLAGEVEGNDAAAKKEHSALFDSKIPSPQSSKQFESDEEKKRVRGLWPAGHDAGIERLKHFLDKKVKNYAAHRSEPALDPSSRLSAYISAGVISIREILHHAKKANDGKHFDEGDRGIDSWVRELVFREFYRQVTVTTPHGNMNLPQNLKFDFVHWEDDEEGYKKWEEGTTGMPFVDAGMRQLKHEKYMHNRLRMNTSSYLRANMLIDYRRGERYFAETLIDWDLSNNTQGWEPSYTIFNPVVQAEKCDKEGDYIRKWVPELKDLKGKDVFDPYNRLSKADFEKLGYPAPHVDFKESQQRAKERYKQDLADADP
ncbi:Putative cryptochrome/DNA photolyase class 1, cryptochrome/DNA photolyase, FAD-binding protein [Septoria linicola]|uniref:Cryptochrome/DNA photolyase class 1, cryptochrome/DNA photolyase, FAD-binding protein n=1 Tax=Septoria linicola TaxID=215465 RepID=A0A9Q9AKU8_9PEZI|nr:putative cryptochrome/DNA photolyase class 1, cryptochrome/DNA photolyase, FAD-binding protein [Septoria linicola]USW50885.1 Putative cryptochrome/DNA photolyase class 1, cryptochrome/DNA photolyase, FAD-binding protein [Septoria linicola]